MEYSVVFFFVFFSRDVRYAAIGANCLYGTGGYYYSSWTCSESVYIYKLDCGVVTAQQNVKAVTSSIAYGTSVSINDHFLVVGN